MLQECDRNAAESELMQSLSELAGLVQLYAAVGDHLPESLQAEYDELLTKIIIDATAHSLMPHIQFADSPIETQPQRSGKPVGDGAAEVRRLTEEMTRRFYSAVKESNFGAQVLDVITGMLLERIRNRIAEEHLSRQEIAASFLPGDDCETATRLREDILDVLFAQSATVADAN